MKNNKLQKEPTHRVEYKIVSKWIDFGYAYSQIEAETVAKFLQRTQPIPNPRTVRVVCLVKE